MASETLVKSVVKNTIHVFFRKWQPSEKTVDQLTKQIYNLTNQKGIHEKQELIFFTKNYLKECIENTLFKNPNSKLKEVFFLPYKDYYEETNNFYHFEDTFFNYTLFVDAVLTTMLEGKSETNPYRFKMTITSLYVQKRKTFEKKQKIEAPKEVFNYFETKFHGDKKILEDITVFLTKEEIDILENSTFMNKKFIEVLKKINNAIKAYFMVEYLEYPDEIKKEILKKAMNPQENYQIITKLQDEIAQKFSTTRSELLNIINNNPLITKKKSLNVFLGIEIYNLESDAYIYNKDQLIKKAIKEIKESINKYANKKGLFLILRNFDKEFIMKNVNDLKECRPTYYKYIIKRHGESLLEDHSLNTKEYNIYQYGISFLKHRIQKDMSEKKKTLKKLLKESKKDLYLIKERRRDVSIKELSHKYHISENTICEIFNKNLLLFGSLEENVKNEMELLKSKK